MENEISLTMYNDKQQAVLKAAASIFLTYGFSAATTDMIQRESGISKKTMYSCFPSKEAMFIAVMEYECAVIAELFQAIHANGNISQTLMQLGTAYLQLILSPSASALFRVIIAEAPRFPEIAHQFYMTGPKGVYEKLAKYLNEAAKNREIDIQSIGDSAASILFINMVRGEAQLECLTHPEARPSAVQINQWVKLAVTTFLNAFSVKN